MDLDKSNLRSIIHQVTAEKLTKLRTQKETLTTHFLPILKSVQSEGDPLQKLVALKTVMTSCPIKDFGNPAQQSQLQDLDVLISLAESAPSGTYNQILTYWVGECVQKIRYKLQQVEYSFLYGSVMSQYLDVNVKKESSATLTQSQEVGDAGSDPTGKEETMKELKDRIFLPSPVDKETFRAFLIEKVFNFVDFDAKKSFTELKDQITKFAKNLDTTPVLPEELRCCIKGLYSVDLLNEDKKTTLRELEQNPTALNELATLLTDYKSNIDSWCWPAPVPIDFRRNMTGKFRAFMDEDIVTALFLQYIGVQWSMKIKAVFLSMYNNGELFKWVEQHRHARGRNTVAQHRDQMHKQNFLTVLPTQMKDQYSSNKYDDDEDDKDVRRKTKTFTPVDVKQRILHTISNECKLNFVLHPESPLTIVQTDMEWFGPSLSHDAILVLMEVLGVPEKWVDFFKRFLQSPLLLEGDSTPKRRQRGVAISHLLSTLFGESLLFVMDLYMQKSSGIVLHRIHDDFWFWDAHEEQVVKAWKAIEEFTAVSGLTINRAKSGSVSVKKGAGEKSVTFGKAPLPQQQIKWGFLDLFSDGVFRINHSKLDPYIEEMTRILTAAPTVVDWVNTHNKYMSFFIRNFGKCALTFGSQHILQILDALKYVQCQVFKASNGNPLIELQSKFEILQGTDLLDAWIYWPVQNGGLGLVNPSLGMLSLLKTYQKIEKDEVLNFSGLPEEDAALWKRLIKASEDKRQKTKYKRPNLNSDEDLLTDSEFTDDELDAYELDGRRKRRYLNFDRICQKSRLHRWYHWGAKYEKLLTSPDEDGPKSGRETGWLTALYGPKLQEYFGTRDFINTKLIPVSLISMMKSSKVKY